MSKPELLFSTQAEFLQNLKNQNVIDARHNPSILLRAFHKAHYSEIQKTTLQTRIKASNLSGPVRPYIPNLLRCFKCQSYDHSITICRDSVTYAHRAEDGHNGKSCEKSERGANCKYDHVAYSSSWPKLIRDK